MKKTTAESFSDIFTSSITLVKTYAEVLRMLKIATIRYKDAGKSGVRAFRESSRSMYGRRAVLALYTPVANKDPRISHDEHQIRTR